jgi:GTP cyclohydrolase I
LGALRSLRSTMKLVAENRQETYFLSNKEKEKWIEDFVERETAVARKRVQDAETSIMQWLNDVTTAENVRMTTRKPETTFEEMSNGIRDSLSDIVSCDAEEGGEDKEDD